MNVQNYLVNTNALELVKSEDLVKGFKLTVCSDLMVVSYVFYLLRFVKSLQQRRIFFRSLF